MIKMATTEIPFEQKFCRKLRGLHRDLYVMKNDASLIQGFPDRVVYFRDKYAILEFKRSENASHRPNQDWYINHFAKYTYSTFVYPENADKVFSELCSFFGL